MEQNNNHSVTLILVVSFVLSFVKGFFGSYPIIFWGLDNIQNFLIYSPIFTLINIVISPILVFIVFYKIGKKFDLKSNLKSSIVRMLIGAYVGHFLANNIIGFFNEYSDFLSTLIGSIVSLTFLTSFFIAFTALAIGYLKQNN